MSGADVDLVVEVQSTGITSAIAQIKALKAAGLQTSSGFKDLAASFEGAMKNISIATADPTKTVSGFTRTLAQQGKSALQLRSQLATLDSEYTKLSKLNPLATAQERLTTAGGGDLSTGLAAGASVAAGRNAFNADIVRDYNVVMQQTAQLEDARTGRLTAQASLNDAVWESGLVGMSATTRAEIELTRAQDQYTASLANSARARGALNNVGSLNLDQQIAKQESYNTAINEQAVALQGVTSAQERLKSAAATANDNGNAFQSSFSYFIIAGEAKEVASAIFGIAGASLAASVEIQRDFADVDRTFSGTKSQLADLKNQLFTLSTSTPNDFADLSQIAALGNQLGVGAADIESFTTAIAEYSTVSGQSAEDASTAFGKISELTGLAASQYVNLASAIEYVARTSVSTEAGIQNTAEEITAIAAGAGFSAQAIVGLSGALASLSIPPERARGALSLYFGALNSAVAAGGPKLAEFATLTGLTTQKIQELVETNKGQQVFTSFLSGLSDLNSVAKTSALDDLGLSTIRVDQTMRALSQNVPLVTKSLADSNAAFNKGTEVGRQYSIVQATLSSTWKEFQDAIQNAAAGIGDLFNIGPLNIVLTIVKSLLIAFQDFSKSPFAPYILGVASAIALLVGGVAAAVGAFLLFTATMKLVPWALSGLGAEQASKGIVQFVAGMFKLNLAVDETAGTVTIAKDKISGLTIAQSNATRAALANADAMTLQSRTALGLGSGLSLATAETEGLTTATVAAGRGFQAMKIAEMGTEIGLAAVVVGTLAAAFINMGNSAGSAAQQAKAFFGGNTDSLSTALAKDQKTYESTGKALGFINTTVTQSKTVTDPWVASLNAATGAQAALNKSTTTTTKSVKDQTVAFGAATSKALAKTLVDIPSIQNLYKNTAANTKLSATGFDNNAFLQATIGSPEGGKAFFANYTAGLAKQLGVSSTTLQTAFANLSAAPNKFTDLGIQQKLNIPAKDVDTVKLLAGTWGTLNGAVNNVSTALSGAAEKTAEQADVQSALNELSTGTSNGFLGATESLTDFQDAVQSGIGKFTDFDTILTSVQGKLKSPLDVNATAFNKGLADANSKATTFFTGLNTLAQGGASSFATQLAAIGPDAQGVLSSALKLSPTAQANLEANARFAAFLASDAFKEALTGGMANSDAAYAEIFSKTGSLSQVQSFIAAQVAGKAAADGWEQAWDIAHPKAPLNIDIQSPSQAQLDIAEQELSGKLTVKASVVPTYDSKLQTNLAKSVKTYTDTVTGASITLPASLSGKALSASLKEWEANESASTAQLQSKMNTKGLSTDLDAWTKTHGNVKITAQIVMPSKLPYGIGYTMKPSNKNGGLIDAYGQGQMPHFASGGMLSGGGSGTSDSLWSKVSAGEYINTAASTKFWGSDFFDSLNRKMLPASFSHMLAAAAVSGNSGPTHVAYVNMQQNNPLTRDPLKQLAVDSQNIAAGIWGSD